jgi:hypothetical protein
VPNKAQITQGRVEYKMFLFDEPPKGFKSLKIFKISLTFRFDKLSNLSKSVHTGENSQILTVSNKKIDIFKLEMPTRLVLVLIGSPYLLGHCKKNLLFLLLTLKQYLIFLLSSAISFCLTDLSFSVFILRKTSK